MTAISELLRQDLVIEEIAATDKIGVLREFAEHLKSRGKVGDTEALVRILVERESLGSTGIGDGVAIPHGKMEDIDDIVVAFGRSSKGVNYQSLDHKPAHLFFLLVTPVHKPGEHLRTLARISRILKNPVLRDNLRQAPRGQELRRLICDEDGKFPQK